MEFIKPATSASVGTVSTRWARHQGGHPLQLAVPDVGAVHSVKNGVNVRPYAEAGLEADMLPAATSTATLGIGRPVGPFLAGVSG